MARVGSSARRYAEAAFQIAVRDDTVDAWLSQLERAAASAADEPVVDLIENPAVPFPKRREALERLLGSDTLPQLQRLAELLLRRGRFDDLPRVYRAFRQLYLRREGITEAHVTSALELDADEMAAIVRRLEEHTGGAVEIDVAVDPALLGGIQVRLGDQLIDGSVRGRLERLRARLRAGTLQETI